MILVLLLALPWFIALVHVLPMSRHRFFDWFGVGGYFLQLLLAIYLLGQVAPNQHRLFAGGWLALDALNLYFVVVTCLVGWTTSLFAVPYLRVEQERGRLTPLRLRLFHSMYGVLMGMMLLCLTTNHLGVLWVALEAATLSAVLMVAMYRTPESFEAAWRYFILGGIGILLALFAVILVDLAATQHGLTGNHALQLDALWDNRHSLNPMLMAVAFLFALAGLGTKSGLVPWHSWLPGAHAEGPTPISAVLSGLLLNVAFYGLLRFKALTEGALHSHWPDQVLLATGLLSVLVGVLRMRAQRDVKRLFSYSSIEHMGLISIGMSLDSPVAHAAALLHVLLHALIKSSIFFSVGHAVQKTRTQRMEHIRGLMHASGRIGWGLLLGTLAIAGLPPFGIFRSEFMMLQITAAEQPWMLPLMLLALWLALLNLLSPVQEMVWGDPLPGLQHLSYRPLRLPMLLHLGIALVLGVYMPVSLWESLLHAAVWVTG